MDTHATTINHMKPFVLLHTEVPPLVSFLYEFQDNAKKVHVCDFPLESEPKVLCAASLKLPRVSTPRTRRGGA
jgi:hypothetical protein